MNILHPFRNSRFVRHFERVMSARHNEDSHVPHEWRMSNPGEPAPRRAIYAGDAEMVVASIFGALVTLVVLILAGALS